MQTRTLLLAALVVALAVRPVHTESVTFITGRVDCVAARWWLKPSTSARRA